jgi:hypothetical protein
MEKIGRGQVWNFANAGKNYPRPDARRRSLLFRFQYYQFQLVDGNSRRKADRQRLKPAMPPVLTGGSLLKKIILNTAILPHFGLKSY